MVAFAQKLLWSPYQQIQRPGWTVVVTPQQLAEAERHLDSANLIAWDYETDGLAWWRGRRPCGVGFAARAPGESVPRCWYVPWRHRTGQPQLQAEHVEAFIARQLKRDVDRIAHNAKFELQMSWAMGWRPPGIVHDTLPQARLLDENRRAGLKELMVSDLKDPDAARYDEILSGEVERLAKMNGLGIEAYREQRGFADIDIWIAGLYGCADVWGTWWLHDHYGRLGVRDYYARVYGTERVLCHALGEAQWVGIQVCPERLAKIGAHAEDVMQKATDEWTKITGTKFELSNNGQILEVLQYRGAKIEAETESGEISVSADALKAIKGVYPEAGCVLMYRDAAKILGTYVKAWLEHRDEFDLIHPVIKSEGANCMPAGELVLTSRGYLPVESVRVGDQVLTHEGRARPVVATSVHAPQPIYRVKLSNGLELRTTGNHEYRTPSGWARADSLQLGAAVLTYGVPEEWRKIEDWPFKVSSWGRVQRIGGRVQALQAKGRWGHLKVMLTRHGAQKRGPNRKDFAVHRLVQQAFGSGPAQDEVRHRNGLAWDNTAQNLEWGSIFDIRKGDRRADLRSREEIRDQVRCAFVPATVVCVVIEAPEQTYGLTVEGDHSHVTAGVVTHNTGRMSSSEPNFQNVPEFSTVFDMEEIEPGKWQPIKGTGRPDPLSVRYAMVQRARKDPYWPDAPVQRVKLSNDYSQIELRVLAQRSRDPRMIHCYLNNLDIHDETERAIFGTGTTYDGGGNKIDGPNRRPSKAINFGLAFGMTPIGFSKQTGVPLEVAEGYFATYFEKFTGMRDYRTNLWAWARQNGGRFDNLFGRTRRLPQLLSEDKWEQLRADRQCIASDAQGSAADLMKEACARLWLWLQRTGAPAKIDLLIHDDVQLSVDVNAMAEVARGVLESMTQFHDIFTHVPIMVEQKWWVESAEALHTTKVKAVK